MKVGLISYGNVRTRMRTTQQRDLSQGPLFWWMCGALDRISWHICTAHLMKCCGMLCFIPLVRLSYQIRTAGTCGRACVFSVRSIALGRRGAIKASASSSWPRPTGGLPGGCAASSVWGAAACGLFAASTRTGRTGVSRGATCASFSSVTRPAKATRTAAIAGSGPRTHFGTRTLVGRHSRPSPAAGRPWKAYRNSARSYGAGSSGEGAIIGRALDTG